MRVTRKEVEGVFSLWAKVAGFKVATSWDDIGAYRLDYNPTYGGYRIERICNASGGVSDVTQRESASAFVYGLRLAIRTLEEQRLSEVGV